MKKYLLTAAGLALSVGLFAQFESNTADEAAYKLETYEGNSTSGIPGNSFTRGGGSLPALQSFGDTIFSETFSNGLNGDGTNGAWTNSGNADWEYRGPGTNPDVSEGSIGAYSGVGNNTNNPIDAETRSNGFMIFDSDYLDNGGDPTNMGQGSNPTPHQCELETPSMDFSGYSSIYVGFSSYFRRFQATTYIVFSTDGGNTWTDTLDIYDSSFPVNEATDNAESEFHILPSSVAGNSNVKARFVFDGETESNQNGSGYYFWQIDDIMFVEAPEHDLAIEEVFMGSPSPDPSPSPVSAQLTTVGYYGRVPAYQLDEEQFSFGSAIRNNGQAAQTNSKVEFFMNGNKVSETQSTSMPIGGLDSVGMASTTSISNPPGNYMMDFVVTADSASGFAANDSITYPLEVTDSTYSWVPLGDVGGAITFANESEFELASTYDIHKTDSITSFEFYVSSSNDSTNHPTVRFFVMDQNENIITQTQNYTLTPAMHDQWNTFMLPDAEELSPGRYFVGFDVTSGPLFWNQHPDNHARGLTFRDVGNGWDILSFTNFGLAPAPAIGMNLVGAGCPELTATVSNVQEAGCGLDDGEATVTPDDPNAIVEWPDGSVGNTHDSLPAGTHTVSIIEGLCRSTIEVTISNLNAPEPQNGGIEVTNPISAAFINAQMAGDMSLTTDAELTADFTGGTGALEYAWSTGDSGQVLSDVGVGSGYRVTAVDENNCQAISNATTLNYPDTMKVCIDTAHMSNDEIELTAQVTNGNPDTYEWNDVDNSNSQSIVVDNSVTHNYLVTVTDVKGGQAGGSYDETWCNQAGFTTTVEELDVSGGINVYPNPNNGRFNVEFSDMNGEYTVTMRNMMGQVVGQERVNVNGSNVSTQDYGNLATGLYILEVSSENGESATYKITVK